MTILHRGHPGFHQACEHPISHAPGHVLSLLPLVSFFPLFQQQERKAGNLTRKFPLVKVLSQCSSVQQDIHLARKSLSSHTHFTEPSWKQKPCCSWSTHITLFSELLSWRAQIPRSWAATEISVIQGSVGVTWPGHILEALPLGLHGPCRQLAPGGHWLHPGCRPEACLRRDFEGLTVSTCWVTVF